MGHFGGGGYFGTTCRPAAVDLLSTVNVGHKGGSSDAAFRCQYCSHLLLLIIRPDRVHRVQRCVLLLPMFRGLCVSECVCVSVRWTLPRPVLKRMNRSKYRSDCVLEWAQGTVYSMGARIPPPRGNRQFWGVPCDAVFRQRSLDSC